TEYMVTYNRSTTEYMVTYNRSTTEYTVTQSSTVRSSKGGGVMKKRRFPYPRIKFPLRGFSNLNTCIKLNRLTAHCWWPYRVWPFKSTPLKKCIGIGSHSVACDVTANNSNGVTTVKTVIVAPQVMFKPFKNTTCTYLNNATVHCTKRKKSKYKTSLNIPSYWPFDFPRPHSCKLLNNYTLTCHAPITTYFNNWPFPFPVPTFCMDLNHETKFCPIHLNSTVKTVLLDWEFPFPYSLPCILMNNNTYYCKGMSRGKLTIVSFKWPFSFQASLCTLQNLHKHYFCCPPFNKNLNMFNLLPKKGTEVTFVIEFWVSLFVCIIGLMGSILSFMVLKMRKNNSSVVYLKALAINDGLSCIWYLIFDAYLIVYNYSSWITNRESNSIHQIPQVASTWLFPIRSSLIAISIWLVVFLSCDRYQIVASPLKAKRCCTVRNAMIKTLVIVVTCFLCHIPQLFSGRAVPSVNSCTNDMWIKHEFTDMGNSDAFQIGYMIVFQGLMRGFIPFVIVAIMNGRIIMKVRQATKRRLDLSNTDPDRKSTDDKLMRLLVAIAILFLILILPWLGYITYSAIFIIFKNDGRLFTIFPFLKQGRIPITITNVPAVTNSSYYLAATAMLCIRLNGALNFFVYILVSSEFQMNFKKLVSCSKGTMRHHQNRFEMTATTSVRRFHKTASKFKKPVSLASRNDIVTTKV
ncbi:unnamed protein product, partial [Owenia fusiformis]